MVLATTSAIPAEVLRLETNDEGVDMNIGHGPGIDFFVGETGGSDYGGTVAVVREQASDANTDCAMVFHTTTDDQVKAGDREKMRITSAGRVGIGDSSPDALLDIQGASDTGVPTLLVDHDDDDVIAVDINAANTTANAIDIDADSVTTAKAVNISADALTSGNAIRIGDNSSSTTSRKTALIVQNHGSAIAATALHVQSDGGITGIALDKNFESTSAATVTGLQVDLDKTGGTTSNNTIYGIDVDLDNTSALDGTNTMVGIRLTPTLTHSDNQGTSNVKGAQITATGGTNGTATAHGLDLTVTGADTNIGIDMVVDNGGTDIILRISADSGDFCTIATTAHGATTITTVDDDATAANLTFTIDGDIILGPAGGDVLPDTDNTRNFGSASKRWANVYTGDLHLKNDRGDWTILEEEEYLCVINNKTGKKYKMGLVPLEDNE